MTELLLPDPLDAARGNNNSNGAPLSLAQTPPLSPAAPRLSSLARASLEAARTAEAGEVLLLSPPARVPPEEAAAGSTGAGGGAPRA